VSLVAHAPELWGMMFDKTDNPEVARRLNRLKRLFPSKSRGLFARCVTQFAPDVVLCTHYLPLETLSDMRRKEERKTNRRAGGADASRTNRRRRSRTDVLPAARGTSDALAGDPAPRPGPFVVSIVTDFEAHALWMDPCVDLYCVAAEETRARLIARGVAAQQVLASGIPISLKFSTAPDSSAVRKTLGVRDDLPLLLVLSGGFGMGPVAKIVAAVDQVKQPFQAVVVTGKNEKLRRELATLDRRHPVTVLGYASNMHELMAAADLIVTKPGGLTSSEVLAMGKPIFIVNPIPGQEAANSDFLLERGAAAKANRVEDLPYRIEQLLGAKKLGEMAGAAKALGRPDAARVICQEVARRALSRTEHQELNRMGK
jgi:processive 1,2-diacylglycerol beta-glucosyltransferase